MEPAQIPAPHRSSIETFRADVRPLRLRVLEFHAWRVARFNRRTDRIGLHCDTGDAWRTIWCFSP